MILVLLVTAIVVGPVVFSVASKWPRRTRMLVAVTAVVLLWAAEVAFVIMVGDPPP